MKYITTADESRSLDREAMKSYGFPEAVLMENAGSDVVSLIPFAKHGRPKVPIRKLSPS